MLVFMDGLTIIGNGSGGSTDHSEGWEAGFGLCTPDAGELSFVLSI